MNDKLSGIERELVLQYLMDGNVPVTITPVKQDNNENIHSGASYFPVAVKDNIDVKKDGKIILQNPPETIKRFINQNVKVEFYFNRVGLYFHSLLQESKKGLILNIPEEIDRIKDVIEVKNYDFSAEVYYEVRTSNNLQLKCIPWLEFPLFTKPVWKSIPLENQKEAKEYLEKFVEEAKVEKNIGYGIQLIPICNYLTYNTEQTMEAMENRKKDFQIVYVDHQRIVLGFDYTTHTFAMNDEYGVKLIFSLKEGPITSRDIFVTCKVNKIYKKENERFYCVDLTYTSIQEEDLRYLYEKSTSNIFD